jgi:hypothetical protein
MAVLDGVSGRGERHAGRESIDGGAFAFAAVAGEAQLLVNGLAATHLILLRVAELTREADPAVEHLPGHFFDAL